MKTTRFLFILPLLVSVGCVPSLHELYTDQTLVFDLTLAGQWRQRDDDYLWEFVPDVEAKSYAVTITEKGKLQSKLTAHLVEIDSQWFFDFYPADDAQIEAGDWLKMHLVAAHLFFRVERDGTAMRLATLNPDIIDTLLKDDPERIRHERLGDRIVLTDKPERLQAFLAEGLKTKQFYTDPITLEHIVPPAFPDTSDRDTQR